MMSPSISLCICTMNRPNDLRRCLSSVFQCTTQPDEVIVSDDSPEGQITQEVVAKFPEVIYQEGPHRGLGPNRNACIRRAQGSHIIFVDDDVCVSPEFFLLARQLIHQIDSKTIITGYEMNHQGTQINKVIPHNADFWGIQCVPVKDHYRAIVINSTIFPSKLFEEVCFDENIRYGNDEIDVARHATSKGYQILYQDNLYVNHYPSSINRDHYRSLIHASRLYTTFKAYWYYEKAPLKTFAYLLLAPLQLAGSVIKQGNIAQLWEIFQAIKLAFRYFLKFKDTAH